jgi:hypothetical protein
MYSLNKSGDICFGAYRLENPKLSLIIRGRLAVCRHVAQLGWPRPAFAEILRRARPDLDPVLIDASLAT